MNSWQIRTPEDQLHAVWQELTEQAALQAAQNKPWLLKLLAEHGAALAARYALWKRRLRQMQQGERRRLQRKLGIGLAGAALLLALAGGPAGASPANTITVSGACDLIEAIGNANDTTNGQPNPDCTAGNATGADTIDLQTGVSLTAVDNNTYGATGLPVIASAITIEGNGHTISRDGSATTETFRILTVGSSGNLTLNGVTISGGDSRDGGGIKNLAPLTLTNSTLTGNSAVTGGGIYSSSASVVVANSTLTGNTAGIDGGGIWSLSGALVVSYSTLSGNSAGRGGGINAYRAAVTVANSTLTGNLATSFGGFGGGLLVYNSNSVTVSNSILTGNSAGTRGGGVYALNSTVTVANSTLTGNSADDGGAIRVVKGAVTVANSTLTENSADWGAGIFANSNVMAISESTFSCNSAVVDGGGIYVSFATVTVANSTFSGNSAGRYGGGIRTRYATVAVSNDTLSGNSAGDEGGGIFAYAGRVTVSNSTLTGNVAGDDGGGIDARFAAAVTLQRNLISGNTAGVTNEVAVYSDSTVTAANYNLFGHGGETDSHAFSNFAPSGSDINATADGESLALAAILVTTLADNDSAVSSGAPPGSAVQTLALPAGSPALDKAPSADCVAPIFDFDQREKARNADGDGSPGSNECDIGAFELQTEAASRIIVHKQTRPDGDATPFDFRLRGPVGRNFTVSDNQPHSTGAIPAGIYTLEEVLPPGWDTATPFSQMTCDDGSPLSAIDLSAGETAVCRFLNYKHGNIIVKQVSIPPVASPSFAMRLINNTSLQKTFFSLANGQQFETGAISSVPTYKLLETVPGGWIRKSIICENGSPSTAIAVPPGGTVTCTVTNKNTPPYSILLSSTSVAENQVVGTLVGNLSAADTVAGDTHTFSFVNDGTPEAAYNGSFQIAGNQLKTGKRFDFEAKSSYSIKLQGTDSAGQSKVKAFVVDIVDGPN